MTVSTAPTPLSYSGNGSTTAFPITWKYNAKSHVVATLRSTAGSETTWALTTNYTLTDPGDSGTLTAVVAPATGETLVITLEPPNTQSSDIPVGGDFPAATVEDGLDLAAQRDQKVQSLFSRALRVPKTDTRTDSMLQLPIDTVRASKFLAFNASGDPIASSGSTSSGDPISAFMATVLDDTTAAAARTTLDAAQALSSLTAETAPAVGDLVYLRDVSEGADNSMTLQNVLKVLNELTEDTSPVTTTDFLLEYDASASAVKKVLPNKFGATTAQTKTGTSADLYVTPAGLLAAIGFSAQFESATQTITSGGALTIAHGLARTPYLIIAVVTCTTNQAPFVVGDRVPCSTNTPLPTTRGVSVYADATNLNVRFGSEATNCIYIVDASNGNGIALTNTSWNIRFLAWA